jgi:protein-S-isoprenylcysteine O-methyltransferase Ste14
MLLLSALDRNLMGTLLVTLQFGLLLVLTALAARNILLGDIPEGALMMMGISIALITWALMHNRPGNFNIHPAPKVRGVLVTTGPYRWIRHPMYTSLLLGAAALAWTSSTFLGWGAWSMLAIVLFMKSSLEEHGMRKQHPGYAAYTLESKRFLPWLF